ncbi:TPA: inverse autotransporter beta domain-containing protein, partial [Yersinia enterocolitica]
MNQPAFPRSAPFRIKLIAWLNIVMQVAFPLTVAFTPSIARADSQKPVHPGLSAQFSQTTTYTLGPLETPASVAARYGMSVDELKKLNQFRTFARGFDNLRQGDEIDVPKAPLSMADRAATLSAPVRVDGTEARVAGLAQQTGSFFANKSHSDAAAYLAKGIATGAATSAVNDWLGQFGTARVTLNADKNLSLKGSQLNLLLPWYDTLDHLLFTQHSIHRTDDRNQLNTGAGWRHFTPAYMAGMNLFFDHDLTHYHSRAGVGAEYWRDNLKLGGNAYVGLTGWRSAPELDHDYEARPANGWDLRAEGYFPAHPQLGAKLMYEQYYGDEVALFGKDKRQKDPQAFTAGVSYTPFPLLSLSAEQRQGTQGENDTRLGVNLTWQPGVSLSKQMDPSAVAARRSLTGSRHDLVERNNNIVLEYRKKELIRLSLHDPVTGRPGEQRALVASLQTTHSLKQLDVDAGALVLAGGNIQVNGGQVTATLPTYQYTSTPETDNSYRVAVTASDVNGNHSNRELTTVVVQAPKVDPASSAATAEPTMLPADGSSTSQLTYTAKDNDGNAILAQPVTLRLGGDAGESVTVSGVKDNGDGSYSATLTAGTQPGSVTVMPQVNGQDMAKTAVSITLISPVDPAHSAIALTAATAHNTAVFRSGDAVQVTVTLKDKQDIPVSGLAAMLTATSVTIPGMIVPEDGPWQDHGDGTYTVMYIATMVGEGQQALLQLSGWQTSVVSDAFTITAGALSPTNSRAAVSLATIVADNTMTTTVTFMAKDTHDNPVSGLAATLAVTGVTGTTFSGFTES